MATSSQKLLLLVEDDPDIRESLAQFLEEDEGFRVIAASNGEEALQLLSSIGRPCLILLDVLMPVLDGHGFLERLGRAPPHLRDTPVVVMSASGQTTLGRPFLPKPFAFEELIATVRRHCGSGERAGARQAS